MIKKLMAFEYLHNTPIDEALENYLSSLIESGLQPKCETISVSDSLDRISFKPIYAKNSAPHYHASAMDGIAVQAKSTFGATATTPVTLAPDKYAIVDTGDALPSGFDAVIMVEDVVFESENEDEIRTGKCSVEISITVSPWTNIRQIGEDICAGEMIISSGTKITPATIGAFMACGISKVEVCKKPIVGLIPSGDEIVAFKEDPKPGEIIEFNSAIFSSIFQNWGCDAKTYPISKDSIDKLVDQLNQAILECDMVLLLAGSSAGRDDYSTKAISEIGQVLYHGISIKPGKPAILGLCNEKPIIGVPGYPASGVCVIEKIAKPIISYLTKTNLNDENIIKALVSRRINSSLKYEETIRVTLGNVNGKNIASPLNRGAGVVTSLVKSDGTITIPQNSEGLEAGDEVCVNTNLTQIDVDNILLVIGSHDPVIDEIANFMHEKYSNIKLSSSHVGSMGAIMAAKRQEMHAGGIHLLDENTGQYNRSYIKKYLDENEVSLVECVYRKQGIIVTKGNPKNIKSFNDLVDGNAIFVNRQKGSGTRILNDYLCKKYSIDSNKIYGYDHEEFTHSSLAMQIKSGSADAGVGIYSAAKMYDLDFIELCEEQYDLIIPNYAFKLKQTKLMLEVLKSQDFAKKVESLGGYRLDKPGQIRN